MKYLLDFDRTLFDMEGLYRVIEIKNPDAALGSVESLSGIDLEALLFPDAVEFFNSHNKDQIEIVSSGFGLTGQWEVEYQQKKIELSAVSKYVGAVHVVPDSKISTIKRIVRESDNITYVDDHPENVQNAVQHIPGLSVVYLDRSAKADEIPGSRRITSLLDIGGII